MTERYPGFAKRLKQARQAKGVSQRGLSAELGRSSPYVCLLEKGEWLPDAEGLLGIAKHLGVRMEWLLTGEDPKGVK